MKEDVVAVVSVSPVRRWLGIGILASIGIMVLYVALVTGPELKAQIFLIVVGLLSLGMADKMRRATVLWIELTETELRDSSGYVITTVEDIASLDSGFLAFKPSNGFLIRTKTRQPRNWRPGLWWRMGRSIGVGGVTPGSQTKSMSQIIQMMVAKRDNTLPTMPLMGPDKD